MKKHILIVEDDAHIRLGLCEALRAEGYEVTDCCSGSEALPMFKQRKPDLVVLDIMLPGKSGYDICREIRATKSRIPILMLSAKGQEVDKVVGLELGADDYVTKPFSVLELAARAKAQIRRAKTLAAATSTPGPVNIGGLTIDTINRKVSREGTQLHLTPIEWQILATLLGAAGRTLTHQQIFDAVWGRQFGSPQQYLRVHITNLRRKVELDPAAPQLIITEPGVGYRAEIAR
jgi:two-component system KDP operon response regulator KdpE